MRVVFMGTPDFAVPCLSAIVAAGHDVVAVYAQPPRPAGRRGLTLQPAPTQLYAEASGIPVYTPTTLKSDEALGVLEGHSADIGVVVAYGMILPQRALDAPKHGCLNVHASALPRWRGAAPIQRAIMAGDDQTAVMVMRMEAGLDTGPVGLSVPLAIGPNETAGALHDRLSQAGADAIVDAITAIEAGTLTFTPQADDGVTYAAKIEKAETRIDFTQAARAVHNHVRGLSPFPGAWFAAADGARVKVLETRLAEAATDGDPVPGALVSAPLVVGCGDGRAVELITVQRAGKRAMSGDAYLRARPIGLGDQVAVL